MRHLIVLVALSSTGAAGPRTPRETVRAALESHAALVAALAESTQLGAVPFEDQACDTRFGHPGQLAPRDRSAFADCLLALHPSVLDHELGSGVAVTLDGHSIDGVLLVGLELRGDRVISIGAAGADAHDATLPTWFETAPLEPTERTRSELAKLGKPAAAAIKLCYDADGGVTTRRLVRSSGVAAFDSEALARLAELGPSAPKRMRGHAIASCTVFAVSAPSRRVVKDLVQPVRIQRVDAPAALAEPPRPLNVPPTAMRALRIAGTEAIAPDAVTRSKILTSGKSTVVGSFKLCIDDAGAVTEATPLRPTGFPDYDATLHAGILAWRYKPYVRDGRAIAVCTAVTFIYTP